MCVRKTVLPSLNHLVEAESDRSATLLERRIKNLGIAEERTCVVDLNDVIEADACTITLVEGFHQNRIAHAARSSFNFGLLTEITAYLGEITLAASINLRCLLRA